MRIQLQEWGPGFDRLADRMLRMLEEMRGPNYFCSRAGPSWTPRVNMYETPEYFIICVELAGISSDEIELQLADGRLQISGHRDRPVLPAELMESVSTEEVGVHFMEIDSGRFCRDIPLPFPIHARHVQGSFRQGLLWIIATRSPREERT